MALRTLPSPGYMCPCLVTVPGQHGRKLPMWEAVMATSSPGSAWVPISSIPKTISASDPGCHSAGHLCLVRIFLYAVSLLASKAAQYPSATFFFCIKYPEEVCYSTGYQQCPLIWSCLRPHIGYRTPHVPKGMAVSIGARSFPGPQPFL